jgi:hypothetical protein
VRPPFSQHLYNEGDLIVVEINKDEACALNEGREITIPPSKIDHRIGVEVPEFLKRPSKMRGGCWPYW